MVFRYCGLGVGHRSTWEAMRMFWEDICRVFNLSEDVFDMGEDMVMEDANLEEDEEGEDISSDSDLETVPGMVDQDGSDNEEEVLEDDEDWESDDEIEEEEEEEEHPVIGR